MNHGNIQILEYYNSIKQKELLWKDLRTYGQMERKKETED